MPAANITDPVYTPSTTGTGTGVGGQPQRDAVSALDGAWESSVDPATILTGDMAVTGTGTGTNPVVTGSFADGGTFTVTLNNVAPTGSVTVATANSNGPRVGPLSDPNVSQDAAPLANEVVAEPTVNPARSTHWNENAGDGTGRNQVVIAFDRPRENGGLYLHDMESRVSTNTTASIVGYDASGATLFTVRPTWDGTDTQCGGPAQSTDNVGCGNQGTSWFSWTDYAVSTLAVTVGDDDACGTQTTGHECNGGTEHLAFSGLKVAESLPETKQVTVVKQVINNNGGTLTSGDFNLYLNGTPIASGATVSLAADAATVVTEDAAAGYQQVSNECVTSGTGGTTVTCTLVNDDIAVVTTTTTAAPTTTTTAPEATTTTTATTAPESTTSTVASDAVESAAATGTTLPSSDVVSGGATLPVTGMDPLSVLAIGVTTVIAGLGLRISALRKRNAA